MCHTSNLRQRRLHEDSKHNAPAQQLLPFDSLVRKNPIGCQLQVTEIKAKHFTTHERVLHVKSKFEGIVLYTHKQATQKFAQDFKIFAWCTRQDVRKYNYIVKRPHWLDINFFVCHDYSSPSHTSSTSTSLCAAATCLRP
jgi:hypothetical protein